MDRGVKHYKPALIRGSFKIEPRLEMHDLAAEEEINRRQRLNFAFTQASLDLAETADRSFFL